MQSRQATTLKLSPIDSSKLMPSQLKPIGKGESYSFSKFRTQDGHIQLGESWWAFARHWRNVLAPGKAGIELIAKFEGFIGSAYLCPAGVPTIGYGQTGKNIFVGMKPITEQQGREWLIAEANRYCSDICQLVYVPLSQNQLDALLSLAYNIGISAFASSTLLAKLNAGDYAEANWQFARWNKINGRPSEGLTRRREAEAKLWLSK